MGANARLEPAALDAARELDAFIAGRRGDGAVVSFVGLARDTAKDGGRVAAIRLDWYPGMTEASLQRIVDAAAERFTVSDVAVVHRCGDIRPGEAMVFAAAAARHRRDAFEAADYLMDRLKSEAALWKREDGPDGSRWIEPTAADADALARWSR